MKSRVVTLVSVLAASSVIAGCGAATTAKAPSSGKSSSSSASSKKPYVIPAILSETGGAAFLGKEESQALIAFEKQLNASGGVDGRPIHFKILDNASSPKTAVSLASSIIGKYPVILNGSIVATASAVDALVSSSGPLDYVLTPGVHPAPHSMVFSTSESTTTQMDAVFNFLQKKGYTKIAALTSNDASGQDGWKQIQGALKTHPGIHLLTHQVFSDTATSVSAQVQNMVATHPQAVVEWSTGGPTQIAFQGLHASALANTPVFTTDGNQTYAQMLGWASFLPKTLYFPAPPVVVPSVVKGAEKKAVDQFYAAFKAVKFNGKTVKPDVGQTLSWDPAKILVHLLKKDGLNANAATLKKSLQHLTGYAGVDGIYNMSPTNHRGLGLSNVYIVRWSASKKTWVPAGGPGGKTIIK